MTAASEVSPCDARRFQAVMNSAPIGAALLAKSGAVLSVNNAMQDIFGAPSQDAILGLSFYDSPSMNNEKVQAAVTLIEQGEPEINFQAAWESHWGKLVNVHVFVTRLVDSTGETVYQIFLEDLLSRSAETDNELWNSMLNASTNEFYVIDGVTQKFLYVSQQAIKQLGYSATEFAAMTPADICPVSTSEDISNNFLTPLNFGTSDSVVAEGLCRRKDGSTYLVEVTFQSTTFQGRAAFLIIAQDITETIATNAALSQAQLFLSSAPDPTVIINTAGVIVFASDQTEALLGYGRNDLVGKKIAQFWLESMSILGPIFRLNQPNQSTNRSAFLNETKQLTHRDGSTIPVEITLSQIQTSDELLVAISCRNVSKRLATEVALEMAKDEAEHATLTKSHLLAAASHDLRQPTQSLAHYSWLMRQAATTPEQIDLATRIQDSVDSIAGLLNTFLDISKLDRGEIQPEICEFDVRQLCRSIVSNFGPTAKAKGIELICDCERYTARSDPALIQRVLENLVANAIRYTQNGTVVVSWSPSTEGLILAVTDTGMGIAHDQLGKIFDEHYQIKSADSANTKGLGLGLSIVQRITKLLHIPVNVTSKLGEGSKFSLTLETGTPKSQTKPGAVKSVPMPTSMNPPTVLLIDDELAVLTSTKLVLERYHCKVHVADTAENALAQLESGWRPDILVTDYRLPGDSGTQFVEKARITLGEDIPAVIITGDMSGVATEINHLSSVRVLHKPTNLRQLVSTIVQLTT